MPRHPNALRLAGASVFATIVAAYVGLGGWILNTYSLLPPFGGGLWKVVIIPTALSWVATFVFAFGGALLLQRAVESDPNHEPVRKPGDGTQE